MLQIIEIESVQASAKGPRPMQAHIKIIGEYDGSGFSCGFVEFTGAYLYVSGEISSVKELPPTSEMASAVRAHYREVQEKQLADLAQKNRDDMAAEISKVGVSKYVPRMNTHGVDSNLTRMEADVQRELAEDEAGAGDGSDSGDEGNRISEKPGAQWGTGKKKEKAKSGKG